MRCLVSFACALALVVAPSMVDAQQSAKEPEAPSKAEGADTQQPARGMQRWHPEAYKDASGNPVPEPQIEYVTPTPSETPGRTETQKRNKRIAIGVTVSIVLLAVGVGVGVAVTSDLRNWEP